MCVGVFARDALGRCSDVAIGCLGLLRPLESPTLRRSFAILYLIDLSLESNLALDTEYIPLISPPNGVLTTLDESVKAIKIGLLNQISYLLSLTLTLSRFYG